MESEIITLKLKTVKVHNFFNIHSYETTLEDDYGTEYILYDKVDFIKEKARERCKVKLDKINDVNYIIDLEPYVYNS